MGKLNLYSNKNIKIMQLEIDNEITLKGREKTLPFNIHMK